MPRFFHDYGATTTFDRVVAQQGDKGATVKAIQQYLLRAGYDLGPTKDDGDFGPKTAAAVKAFQQAAPASSKQDGRVWESTFQQLKAAPVVDPAIQPPPASIVSKPDGSIKMDLPFTFRVPTWAWIAGGGTAAMLIAGVLLRKR